MEWEKLATQIASTLHKQHVCGYRKFRGAVEMGEIEQACMG